MQLKNVSSRLILLGTLILANVHAVGAKPTGEPDWRVASIGQFSQALDGFNEEREPRNLPAIRAAIIELKGRVVDGPDAPAAIELVVQFLRSEAIAEFVNKRRSGQIPAASVELEFVKNHASSREAVGILQAGLVRFPDSPALLRAALNSDLAPPESTRRIEWMQRLLRAEPDASVYRLMLARSLAHQRKLAQARQESIHLIDRVKVEQEEVAYLIDELPWMFDDSTEECRMLASRLRTLAAEIPQEFRSAQHEGGGLDFGFKDDAERAVKLKSFREQLAEIRSALLQSSCGGAGQ